MTFQQHKHSTEKIDLPSYECENVRGAQAQMLRRCDVKADDTAVTAVSPSAGMGGGDGQSHFIQLWMQLEKLMEAGSLLEFAWFCGSVRSCRLENTQL